MNLFSVFFLNVMMKYSKILIEYQAKIFIFKLFLNHCNVAYKTKTLPSNITLPTAPHSPAAVRFVRSDFRVPIFPGKFIPFRLLCLLWMQSGNFESALHFAQLRVSGNTPYP